MLISYIINIVSVRLLQCTNHIIDVRKTLMLLYNTSSGACTVCSGIPPFLLRWWSDNFTTLYCPAQNDRSDAQFIINDSFSFYPVHIQALSSFEMKKRLFVLSLNQVAIIIHFMTTATIQFITIFSHNKTNN